MQVIEHTLISLKVQNNMDLNKILVDSFLRLSLYKAYILGLGAIYLIVNLVFYHKKYKEEFYDLKRYKMIFANAVIASMLFFSGSLLYTNDPDTLKYLDVVSPFCTCLPTLLVLFVMMANIYIKNLYQK